MYLVRGMGFVKQREGKQAIVLDVTVHHLPPLPRLTSQMSHTDNFFSSSSPQHHLH